MIRGYVGKVWEKSDKKEEQKGRNGGRDEQKRKEMIEGKEWNKGAVEQVRISMDTLASVVTSAQSSPTEAYLICFR